MMHVLGYHIQYWCWSLFLRVVGLATFILDRVEKFNPSDDGALKNAFGMYGF